MSSRRKSIPEHVLGNIDVLKSDAQKQGYTIKELAEKCGLSISTLCNLVNGNLSPARDSYNKIAAVLNWEAWQ